GATRLVGRDGCAGSSPLGEGALQVSLGSIEGEIPYEQSLTHRSFRSILTAAGPWSGATLDHLRLVRHDRWETGNAARIEFPGRRAAERVETDGLDEGR